MRSRSCASTRTVTWIAWARRPRLRRALSGRMCLVWRVAFEEPSGRLVDSRLVPMLVDLRGSAGRRSPEWVQSFLQQAGDLMHARGREASVRPGGLRSARHANARSSMRAQRERDIAGRTDRARHRLTTRPVRSAGRSRTRRSCVSGRGSRTKRRRPTPGDSRHRANRAATGAICCSCSCRSDAARNRRPSPRWRLHPAAPVGERSLDRFRRPGSGPPKTRRMACRLRHARSRFHPTDDSAVGGTAVRDVGLRACGANRTGRTGNRGHAPIARSRGGIARVPVGRWP